MVFSNRELPPTVISHLAFCNSSVRHLQVKTTSGPVYKKLTEQNNSVNVTQ